MAGKQQQHSGAHVRPGSHRRQRLPRPALQGCGAGSSSERTRTAITGALKKKLKVGGGKHSEWIDNG